jgi:ribosomal-protein-alanine N-acetyltransferase
VTFLETTRLLFRSHEAQDEANFVKMQTDPEVRRYVGGQAWSREKAVQRFRTAYLNKPSKVYGLWATILKTEGTYIGCCGLHAPSNAKGRKSAKLGYYLARPYWRRGLATEACNAFIDAAFSRLNLNGLFADVQEGHQVSERILQKLGFALVNREELPGRTIHVYHLPREEWGKRTT